MYTIIGRWGNSQAVRLPKAALERTGLRENDRVEIRVDNGYLLIMPTQAGRQRSMVASNSPR